MNFLKNPQKTGKKIAIGLAPFHFLFTAGDSILSVRKNS